jgi:hypothetical protein
MTASPAAAAGFPADFPASGGGLSECRCFQVTPLTGYNESGQPASAISVGLKHSRLHAGQAEDWAQVSLMFLYFVNVHNSLLHLRLLVGCPSVHSSRVTCSTSFAACTCSCHYAWCCHIFKCR